MVVENKSKMNKDKNSPPVSHCWELDESNFVSYPILLHISVTIAHPHLLLVKGNLSHRGKFLWAVNSSFCNYALIFASFLSFQHCFHWPIWFSIYFLLYLHPTHWTSPITSLFYPRPRFLVVCLLHKCFLAAVTRSSLEKVKPPTCSTHHGVFSPLDPSTF